MILLTKKEQESMLNLSKEFVNIHQEILQIERAIQEMEERSSQLISQLERCRENEGDFICELEKKYGIGSLDPINLIWKKETINNEVH
jgi:superfamily II helicase